MKRILVMFVMLLVVMPMMAQTGLHANELFMGHIIPQQRMVETRVRGKTLEKYRLTYYRSLRFMATKDETQRLRRLIDDDAKGHFVSIVERQNTFTQKIQVPAQDGKTRFLCYQEKTTRQKEQLEVTVIYMEGTVNSLGQLEELLK